MKPHSIILSIISYMSSVCSNAAIQNVICPLIRYGQCDLKAYLVPKYLGVEIYVKNTPDDTITCEGILTKIDSSYMYRAKVQPNLSIVCARNKRGGLTHIATIEYIGLASVQTNVYVSYGMSWEVTATLQLPTYLRPDTNSFYSIIALKEGSCNGLFLSYATIITKKSVQDSGGRWNVMYSSNNPVNIFMTNPKLCASTMYNAHFTERNYNEYIGTANIDGPVLSKLMNVNCVVGMKCQVPINGVFTATSRKFIVSKTYILDKSSEMNYISQNLYQYMLNIDEYVIDLQPFSPLNIYWFPTGKDDGVYIGVINVAIFGAQEIFLYKYIFPKDSEFLLYERNRSFRDRTWSLISRIKGVNAIKFNYNFDVAKEYEFRYCNPADESLRCPEPITHQNTALAAKLIPRGVVQDANYVCEYDLPCEISFNTINMSQDGRDENILLANECGAGFDKDSIYTLDGLSTSKRIQTLTSTEFSWTPNKQNPSAQNVGKVLNLCWCNKNGTKEYICKPEDYSIKVGRVLLTGDRENAVNCWLGSVCSVIMDGDFNKIFGRLVLTKYCFSEAVVKFEGDKKEFDVDVFRDAIGAKVSLVRADLSRDGLFRGDCLYTLTTHSNTPGSLAGKYKVCWRPTATQHTVEDTNVMVNIRGLLEDGGFNRLATRLERFRYYSHIGQRVPVKLKELVEGEQYLLLDQSCESAGNALNIRIALVNGEASLITDIKADYFKICWCLAKLEVSCDRIENYKMIVGEVTTSGIVNMKRDVECDSHSACNIKLDFRTPFGIVKGKLFPAEFGSKLVARKGPCTINPKHTDVLILNTSSSTPLVHEQYGNLLNLKYASTFETMSYGNNVPGPYSLCFNSASNACSRLISHFTLKGVYVNNVAILVNFGKPFNISIRGYKLGSDTKAFLSLDRTCIYNNKSEYNIRISMSQKADHAYDDNGNSVLLWIGVKVTRLFNKQRSLNDYDNILNDHFDLWQKLFLCAGSGKNTVYTGTHYLVSGPKRINRLTPSPNNKIEAFLHTRWPVTTHNVMVVLFLESPNHKVSCEDNTLYSVRVICNFYSFEDDYIRLPSTTNINESLICWCSGKQCTSVDDYNTTIKHPSMHHTSTSFRLFPYNSSNRVKIAFTGAVSIMDQMRIVDVNVKCGGVHSSKMTQNLDLKSNSVPIDASIDDRSVMGLGKRITRRGALVTWESFLIPLTVKKEMFLLYKICFCSFKINERCSADEDFTDWTGAIVRDEVLEKKSLIVRIHLVTSKDLPSTLCNAHNNTASSSMPVLYHVDGNLDRAAAFVRERVQRYLNYEGFLYEACFADADNGEMPYKRFLSDNKSGLFYAQKIFIKTATPQDIVIRGIGLSSFVFHHLAIINVDLSCDTFSKSDPVDVIPVTKTFDPNSVLFENITLQEFGYYRLCVKLEGSLEAPSPPLWYDAGSLISHGFYSSAISDLVAIPLFSKVQRQNTKSVKERNALCTLTGYRDLVQLCVLVKDGLILLSDCTNKIWVASVNTERGSINITKVRKDIILEVKGAEAEQNWLFCREFPQERKLILVGEAHLAVILLPFLPNKIDVMSVILHKIVNPLDAVIFSNAIILSDAYTRSATALIFKDSSFTSGFHRILLFRNVYWIAMHIINNSPSQLLVLDPEINTLARYKIFIDDIKIRHKLIDLYTSSEGFYRPSSMDTYRALFKKQPVDFLFVTENTTGRIIVFRLDGRISSYKVMNTRGLVSRITADPDSKTVFISSWQKYMGVIEQFILYKSIDSYSKLNFYYNVLDRYQGGDVISLEPILRGDVFEFFYLENSPSHNTLDFDAIGLALDPKTGVISGTIKTSGTHVFTVFGGNLFKQVYTLITISASCPPSKEFNRNKMDCTDCPIGTFRNDETDDVCITCDSVRMNSTTRTPRSALFSDCLCKAGFYLNEGECDPCPAGLYKSEVGDSVCSSTCGNNMTSDVTGATLRTELNCYCMPRFYDLRLLGNKDEEIPPELLESAGGSLRNKTGKSVTFGDLTEGDSICIPCEVGNYCPGGKIKPQACGEGRNTKGKYNTRDADCACDLGYGYDKFSKKCSPCSEFGYKDVIDNVPCSYCHCHLNSDNELHSPQSLTIYEFDRSTAPLQGYKEHVRTLSNSWLVTNVLAARNVEECQYCISGFYFEQNVKDCLPCPLDSFCPGFENQPVRCGPNSVTIRDRAVSSLDCLCSVGYGNISQGRNPINLTLVCTQCPLGFFQHLHGTDIPCLPCPLHSTTISTGSNSLLKCVPEPGYYIENVNFADDNFESQYEKSRLGLYGSREILECQQGYNYMPKAIFEAVVMKESLSSCSNECIGNIYCIGYAFYRNEDDYTMMETSPFTKWKILLFNGSKYHEIKLSKCRLFFFNLEIDYNKRESVSSVFCRTSGDFTYFSIPCPLDHYCPGSHSVIACPPFSKTIGQGSKTLEACLCVPGYERSTSTRGKCKPCEMGWYKPELGNVSCKRCPDKFRTFVLGAKYITDCGCTPGHYAKVTPFESIQPKFMYIRDKTGHVSKSTSLELYLNYNKAVLPKDGISDMTRGLDSLIFLSHELLLIPTTAPSEILDSIENYKIITCEKCKPDHYCPGGWLKTHNHERIHNIPYRCPFGSGIPPQSTSPSFITQCLCLPGYMVNMDVLSFDYQGLIDIPNLSSPLSFFETVIQRDISNKSQCIRCEGGMYKEGQENSSCNGRCMQYATTYGASVSKSQCFCQYGRYMREGRVNDVAHLKCAPCMSGALCPGGLSLDVVSKLRNNPNFKDIELSHHIRPLPRFGYYATYRVGDVWSPDDDELPSSVVNSIPINEMDFHPCPLESRCDGKFAGYCSQGSRGYLCSNCEDDYDVFHYRGQCVRCLSVLQEVRKYIESRLVLWFIALLLLYLVEHRLVVPCVILKIWIEFCHSMIPYGMIHLNTQSGLRKFIWYYNGLFGYFSTLFTYLRIRCVVPWLSGKLSFTHFWYIHKFFQGLHPLIDSVLLYSIYNTLKFTANSTLRIVDFLRGRNARKEGLDANERGKYLNLTTCLMVMYYLSFQFICQELLQMIWCVDVKYKNEDSISILLHLPTQICHRSNHIYFYSSSIAMMLLFLLTIIYIIGPYRLAKRHDNFLLTCGHRYYYKAWDTINFLKRLILAIICTFQTAPISSGHAEKLKVIANCLLSVVTLILHMKAEPFQLRNDNLFNKLELYTITTNLATGFIIQGSFSFDFNYTSLMPLLLCVCVLFLFVWHVLVEYGYMSELDHGVCPSCLFRICRGSIAWNTNAQVTFNYVNKECIIESPFVCPFGLKYPRLGGYSRVSSSGRNALFRCMHQSINQFIMEQNSLTVPRYWMEFLIRYAFVYKHLYIKHIQMDDVNVLMDSLLNNEIYDKEPTTPWSISNATLNTKPTIFKLCYIQFESQRNNRPVELKRSYELVCEKLKDATNDDQSAQLFNLIYELELELHALNQQLSTLITHAKDGERAAQNIVHLKQGIKHIVDTTLTNDDILAQIDEENRRRKQTASQRRDL